MSTSGDITSTSGDGQYIGGYHDACGKQIDKSLSVSIENPQCTEHPPMYS